MKIAVASQNRREITGHTGRCRKFWIYDITVDGDIAGKQLLELAKSQSFHESPPRAPHPLDDAQVLISGGMGKGMLRRLAAKGIEAVITRDTAPDAAVAALLDGSLQCIAPEAAHHHSHAHGHGHPDGHTCGTSASGG